ncbi:hypothetical protein MMC28_004385 [Mycoblastus sanguinarius]|nr:hypothetical protein [Mycoblastus sanguinarius]
MNKTKKSTKAATPPFPLLKLPPEIRNRIWTFTVVQKGSITLCRGKRPPTLGAGTTVLRSGKKARLAGDDKWRIIAYLSRSSLSVAFVCRQIYLEATPIYYAKNTFLVETYKYEGTSRIEDPSLLQHFTRDIGPEAARQITAVTFKNLWFPVERYVLLLPGLQHLSVFNHPLNEFRQDELEKYVKIRPSLVFSGPDSYPSDEYDSDDF